jgi:hypothetical protein
VCVVTTTTTVAMPGGHPSPPIDLAALDAAIRRKRHHKRCRKCGFGRSGSDNGILGRKRCYTCDVRTIEAIVRRLIDRVGPGEALDQLKALAPKSPK